MVYCTFAAGRPLFGAALTWRGCAPRGRILMPVASVALKQVALPEFGEPTVMPKIPPATYQARIETLLARGGSVGLDGFVVYGDREHAANVAYLTGYDPRFEETLLILLPGKTPQLLVGNEGWGYAEIVAGPYERVLYQTFSLPGAAARPFVVADPHPVGKRRAFRTDRSARSAGSRSAPATMASTRPRSTCRPSSPTSLRARGRRTRQRRQRRRPDDEPGRWACAPSTRPTSSPPSNSRQPSPRKACATCSPTSSPA